MILAVEVFLDWLRREGTVWSTHPTREDVMREFDRIWFLLGDRQIEDLIDLPLITDPDVLDTLDVFTEIMTPSQLFDDNLSSLVMCRMVTSVLSTATVTLRALPMSGSQCSRVRDSTITRRAFGLASWAMIW